MDNQKISRIIMPAMITASLLISHSVFATSTPTSTVQILAEVITNPTTTPFTPGAIMGGSSAESLQAVFVNGKGYPGSIVTIIIDGTISGIAIVDSNGYYEYRTPFSRSGTAVLQAFETTPQGDISPLVTIPITLARYSETKVIDLHMLPTMYVDTVAAMVGDTITITGNGVPNSSLTIIAQNGQGEQKEYTVIVDAAGSYQLSVPTTVSDVPTFRISTRYVSQSTGETVYGDSSVVSIGIDRITRQRVDKAQSKVCDISIDGRVNLIDFSILSFYYRNPRNAPPSVDLTKDGVINLDDISLLAYCWTG